MKNVINNEHDKQNIKRKTYNFICRTLTPLSPFVRTSITNQAKKQNGRLHVLLHT
jgi:hypothetical protein